MKLGSRDWEWKEPSIHISSVAAGRIPEHIQLIAKYWTRYKILQTPQYVHRYSPAELQGFIAAGQIIIEQCTLQELKIIM